MCENEKYGYHQDRHHGSHHRHHHCHRGYSTIAKRTGETTLIPEILFEVANIEEGDFFKIYIRKLKRDEH